MYWYYKVIFTAIVILVLGGIVFAFRGFLPSMPDWFSKDEKAVAIDPGTTASSDTAAATLPPGAPPAIPARHALSGPDAPLPTDPASLQVAQKLDVARGHIQNNQILQARKVLDAILKDPQLKPYSPYWMRAATLLGEINTQIIFTDIEVPQKVAHIVKRGDTIWDIAKQYDVTQAMIMRSNNIDPASPRIIPGQVLKIYDAQWAIEVSKQHHTLVLKDGASIFKIYRIGIGRQDRTPIGTFKIVTKESEPIWTDIRAGRRYAYGDPNNVLGTRWMGIQAIGTTSPLLEGYGIHGTWEPESIGQARSNGCVRMLNEEVEELFALVPYGTQVVIHE